MTEVLQIQGLGVSIGGRVLLKGVSLSLQAGEVLGLIGASGSGKSLATLAVMGLLPSKAEVSGEIVLEGQRLDNLGETAMRDLRGRRMGLVFQEPATALDPVRQIGDQVAEAVLCHRRGSRTQAARLADQALDAVGLSQAAAPRNRYPHQLSGGQRQRVAVAMAMVLRPAVLMADEPTTALDPIAARQMLQLLRTLAKETDTAVLLVSHDLAAVAGVVDRLAVLQAGEVVETGDCASMLSAPVHPYTRALVAAARASPARSVQRRVEGPPALEAHALTCTYAAPSQGLLRPRGRVTALDGVSLSLAPGERLGLAGLSGSGKSTLLRTLLGLQPIRSGEVRLGGEAFSPASPSAQRRLRRDIQVVLQDPYASFDPTWRVERLVAEPLALADPVPDRRERRRRVEDLLEQLGLERADADRLPYAFSGGQRQRIAIARALILEPRVLLLDEITAALDAATRAQTLELLASIGRQRSLAMLFISHDLATLRTVTDRLLVLDGGRIVEAGETEAVFAHPRHPVTQALVAAAPKLSPGAQA